MFPNTKRLHLFLYHQYPIKTTQRASPDTEISLSKLSPKNANMNLSTKKPSAARPSCGDFSSKPVLSRVYCNQPQPRPTIMAQGPFSYYEPEYHNLNDRSQQTVII